MKFIMPLLAIAMVLSGGCSTPNKPSKITLSKPAQSALSAVRDSDQDGYGDRALVVATPSATGSMRGTYDEHDFILLRITPFKDLAIGDVITYEWAGNQYTHRIVEADGEGYCTKGDAEKFVDPMTVTEGTYLGYTVAYAINMETGATRRIDVKARGGKGTVALVSGTVPQPN